MSRSNDILRGIADNLSELRFLAEARATNLDPKVTTGGSESQVPTRPRSTEDECLDILELANRDVAKRIDRERRRPVIKETVQQREYWVLVGGEGRRVEAVAEDYGVSPGYVEKIRASHGRARRTGLPLGQRGRPKGT